MKIILNAPDGATTAEIIALASVANAAIDLGIERRRIGEWMAITVGDDHRQTYGVVLRATCISVYPPARRDER